MGNEAAPTNISLTLFCSLVVLLGAVVTALIFGNMAALMA